MTRGLDSKGNMSKTYQVGIKESQIYWFEITADSTEEARRLVANRASAKGIKELGIHPELRPVRDINPKDWVVIPGARP